MRRSRDEISFEQMRRSPHQHHLPDTYTRKLLNTLRTYARTGTAILY
eukprot:COSAG01_NODE_119_length_25410_cov_1333.312275_22_plen_47_part_00